MLKKVPVFKFLTILLVSLTLTAFVVSCSDNVEPENPEPSTNTEVENEGDTDKETDKDTDKDKETDNDTDKDKGGESKEENGKETDTGTGSNPSQTLVAPTELKVSQGTVNGEIKLTWKATTASYYWIYQSLQNNPAEAECITTTATSSTATDGYSMKFSGKTRTYYFWVKSADGYQDNAKTSDFSQPVTYEYINNIAAPKDFAVKAATETNNVQLTWTPDDFEYYWIYYNDKNDTETATCATKSATSSDATGYKIKLTKSGTYYFWIMGSNSKYESAYIETSVFSEPVSYEFTNTLSVPTNVNVIPDTKLNRVRLFWTPNDTATYYWIYYNSEDNPQTAKCTIQYATSSDAVSGCSIAFTASGTYYFWVKSAEDWANSSATSDFSTVASLDFTYTQLTAPTGLSVKLGPTTTTAIVNWNDNNFTTYWIYYNTEDNPQTATCATKDPTFTTSGATIELPTTGLYYFWIKAADDIYDNSPASDFSGSVSCVFPEKMPAPTGLKVEALSYPKNVKVTWNDDSSTFYWLYYNTENNPETATCATRYLSSYNVTDGYTMTLPSYGKYYFWLRGASDTTDNAETTDFSSVATIEFKLDVPTLTKAEKGSDPQAVKLFWSESNGSKYYWIYHNTENNPNTATRITSTMTYSSSGYVYNLTTKGTHYFWIKGATGSSDSADSSDFSSVLTYDLTIEPPTGISVQAGTYYNSVILNWTPNGSEKYWIYFSTQNNFENASLETSWAGNINDNGVCEYEKRNLNIIGTYYFWILGATGNSNSSLKSDPSTVATYNFSITAPSELSLTVEDNNTTKNVTSGSTQARVVTVNWNSSGASNYWVYYNTEDNQQTATCVTKDVSSRTYYQFNFPKSGTYYFWVKKATGSTVNAASSDFSTSVSCTYTNPIAAPTGLSVTPVSGYSNKVDVKWTDNSHDNYKWYWIYYSTKNDPDKATCVAKTQYMSSGCTITLNAYGTYYFWIKLADGADNTNTSNLSSDFSSDEVSYDYY